MAVLFDVIDKDRAENVSSKLRVNWTRIGAVAPEVTPSFQASPNHSLNLAAPHKYLPLHLLF